MTVTPIKSNCQRKKNMQRLLSWNARNLPLANLQDRNKFI